MWWQRCRLAHNTQNVLFFSRLFSFLLLLFIFFKCSTEVLLVVQLIEVDADVRQLRIRMRTIRDTGQCSYSYKSKVNRKKTNVHTKSRWRKSKLSENKTVRIEHWPVLPSTARLDGCCVLCLANCACATIFLFNFVLRRILLGQLLGLCSAIFVCLLFFLLFFAFLCSLLVQPYMQYLPTIVLSLQTFEWQTTNTMNKGDNEFCGFVRLAKQATTWAGAPRVRTEDCPRFMIILLFCCVSELSLFHEYCFWCAVESIYSNAQIHYIDERRKTKEKNWICDLHIDSSALRLNPVTLCRGPGQSALICAAWNVISRNGQQRENVSDWNFQCSTLPLCFPPTID